MNDFQSIENNKFDFLNIIFSKIDNEKLILNDLLESSLNKNFNANGYYKYFETCFKHFVYQNIEKKKKSQKTEVSIDLIQRLIIEGWIESDFKNLGVKNLIFRSNEGIDLRLSSINNLFSWSSNDIYIKEKKKEFDDRSGKKIKDPDIITNKVNFLDNKDIFKKFNILISEDSTTNRLNKIVEFETNNFIHERSHLFDFYENK